MEQTDQLFATNLGIALSDIDMVESNYAKECCSIENNLAFNSSFDVEIPFDTTILRPKATLHSRVQQHHLQEISNHSTSPQNAEGGPPSSPRPSPHRSSQNCLMEQTDQTANVDDSELVSATFKPASLNGEAARAIPFKRPPQVAQSPRQVAKKPRTRSASVSSSDSSASRSFGSFSSGSTVSCSSSSSSSPIDSSEELSDSENSVIKNKSAGQKTNIKGKTKVDGKDYTTGNPTSRNKLTCADSDFEDEDNEDIESDVALVSKKAKPLRDQQKTRRYQHVTDRQQESALLIVKGKRAIKLSAKALESVRHEEEFRMLDDEIVHGRHTINNSYIKPEPQPPQLQGGQQSTSVPFPIPRTFRDPIGERKGEIMGSYMATKKPLTSLLYSSSASDAKEILMHWILHGDCITISDILNDEALQSLMRSNFPRFKFPDAKKIEQMLGVKKSDLVKNLQDLLDTTMGPIVNLTIELKPQMILCIAAHWWTPNFKAHSALLSAEKVVASDRGKMEDAVTELIMSTLTFWNLDNKLLILVGDASVRELTQETMSDYFWIPSLAEQ